MGRYKVIANPRAGGGTAARVISRLEALLEEAGLDHDLVTTNGSGHAAELAREAAQDGCDVVVAAGGDGTVNEVLNGLMQAKETGHAGAALGVVPIGRGNDFAHAVGIPRELAVACQVLARNQRRLVDVGRVVGGMAPLGRYFCNCLGVGFDAIGTIEANKLPPMGGFLNYLIAVFKTIFLYFRAPLTAIEYDGQRLTQPSLMISVMNGRRVGGGFLMAPDARPDDGLLDLCIAGEVSRAGIFRLIPHFMRGTQAGHPAIAMGQARAVRIEAVHGVLPAQVDGEIICVDGKSLEIELIPSHLAVLVDNNGDTP